MSSRVMRAFAVAQHRAAETVLEEAREEVAGLVQAAREEAAREKQTLLAAAQAEADARKARILAETSAAAQAALATLHTDVAEALAAAIARVFGELDMADAVSRAATHALSDVAARHGATVHVHPSAFPSTRAALDGAADSVRVTADEALPRDGCVLETEAGIVRAGLSDQLAILRQVFLDAASATPAPQTADSLHV